MKVISMNEMHEALGQFSVKQLDQGRPSIMRGETFASAVDVAYGCGNPNINHD